MVLWPSETESHTSPDMAVQFVGNSNFDIYWSPNWTRVKSLCTTYPLPHGGATQLVPTVLGTLWVHFVHMLATTILVLFSLVLFPCFKIFSWKWKSRAWDDRLCLRLFIVTQEYQHNLSPQSTVTHYGPAGALHVPKQTSGQWGIVVKHDTTVYGAVIFEKNKTMVVGMETVQSQRKPALRNKNVQNHQMRCQQKRCKAWKHMQIKKPAGALLMDSLLKRHNRERLTLNNSGSGLERFLLLK